MSIQDKLNSEVERVGYVTVKSEAVSGGGFKVLARRESDGEYVVWFYNDERDTLHSGKYFELPGYGGDVKAQVAAAEEYYKNRD